MTFPFMTTGFTGWQPSFINFQMCSTNPMNSLNIMWNQLGTKNLANSMMYHYPVFSMNNFTPFFNGTSNDYLTNPFYSVAQTMWNFNQSGNTIWGGSNNNMFGNMDFSKMWGNFTGSGSSSSVGGERTKTAEQIEYQRKYNKLLSLMKQLKDAEEITSAQKDIINAAIVADNENSKGEWKDKFNALKKAYDKIDDKNIKKYLVKNMDASVNGESGAENSFRVQLTDAGYEYTATDVDTKLNALVCAIDELSDSNPRISNGLIDALDIESADTNILDLISSWNSEKGNLNVGNKRIMAYIADKYNDSKIKDESREEIKTSLVKPLYLSLINKAKDLANQLEGEEIDNLNNAITTLATEYEKLDKNMSTSFVQAFDNLYIATRWAAIKVIEKEADEYYGEIDSKFFNNELFDDDVKDDLIAEGFSKTEIDAQKVNYAAIKHDDNGDGGNDDEDFGDTPEKQIEYLKSEGLVETLEGKTYVGGETVYRETTPTGENGKAKLFIIKDGKLYELTDPVLNANGKYSAEALKEVDADDIKTAHDEKIAEEEAAAEKAADEEAKELVDIREKGIEVSRKLCGWTTKDDTEYIAEVLQKINKDNVLEFFDGAFEHSSINENAVRNKNRYKIEGIIEKMSDDSRHNTHITKELVVNLVNAFLAKAAEMGLEKTTEYRVLAAYLETANKAEKGFRKKVTREDIKGINDRFSSKKNAINIWFMTGNYQISEVIDDMIRRLYPQMKN